MITVKKIISAFLILMMAVSLCGCDSLSKLSEVELPPPPLIEDAEKASQTSQEISGIEAPEKVNEPAAKVIVNITKTSEQHYDPATGEQLILDFSYETPRVDILWRDSAANAINEFIAMLDETYCTGNDYGNGSSDGLNMMLELAIDNFTYAYETGADINLEMSSNRSVSIERSDDAVLSLLYTTYTYKGGESGEYDYRAYVFDTENGSLVSFDTLASYNSELRQYVLDSLKDFAAKNPEIIDAGEITEETLDGLLAGAWCLDDGGMKIFFNKDNTLHLFVIPFSELDTLIDEKWLPKAKDGSGELTAISQSEFTDGSMEVVDKVFADSEGEDICLVVSGTVYDVNVTRVGYSDFNGTFYETEQLWNCSYMDDCVLQIRAAIPDGMPNLSVSYKTADEEFISLLISQSGEDGRIILVDDSDITTLG